MQRNRLLVLTSILAILFWLGCSHAKHYYSLGQQLEKIGRYGDALSAYQAALQQSAHDHREQSQIYFRMGECLIRLERVPEAYASFEKSAMSDFNNGLAHLRLGEFLLAGGAADRAREQAEIAMRLNGRTGEAVALVGASLEAAGQKEQAKEAYREAVTLEPGRASVAIALADIYNHDNQTRQAQDILEESIRANPKSPMPLLALARLHEQEGQLGAAEDSYRRAVQAQDDPDTNLRLAQFLQRTSRIAESEQVLRRVDAQRPTDPTALADFELLAGRPTNALESYQATLVSHSQASKNPRASSWRQERARVATRIVEADMELASGKTNAERSARLARARSHIREFEADLDPATVAVLEAEVALAEDNLPLASSKAAAAISLAPRSAAALYVQGVVRLRCSDPAGARSEWLKALESDSHFAPARLALGEQALQLGDEKGAEEYVLGVVRDEPANLRALTLFARVLAAEKRFDAARIIAHRAQALDPTSAVPHVLLAQIAMRQKRDGESLIQFEQAVLLDPHSQEAVEGLTQLYRTGTITRPMLAKMEKVASAPPASATLMEIAGRLYADHGWYSDAQRCLSESLKMDPQRNTAAAALAQAFAATGDLKAAAATAARTGGNSAAVLAGVKAQEQNDVHAAIENYERAVRGGENTGVAANNLAWLYAEQGINLPRALELAQTAQSLSPRDPAVLDTVGVVHLKMHSYSEAIKVLESAKQMARKTAAEVQLVAQIRHHLAEAYLRAGNTVAATAVERE